MNPVVPDPGVHRAARLHSIGDCGDAAHVGAQVWDTWRHIHGTRNARGILIAVPYIAILVGCGRIIEGLRVLGQLGPALPPRETEARRAVADWASAHINATVTEHQPRCARVLDHVYQIDTHASSHGRIRQLPSTDDWYEHFL